MKSFKRLVVFMLVLSMVIGTMVPAFAFSDVEDTYYEDEINKLAAVGVVNGDPEGTFRPEDNITRAEVAVIICKMLGAGNTMDAQKNMPSAFSDVATGEWYTGAINLATGNGIIKGFPDGTFRPNDNITVAQAVTLMVKALGRGVYVDEAGQWPANYIAEGAKLGVTKNIVAGSQDDLASRGMVAAMGWNSLDIEVWDVDSTNNKGEILSSKTETMLEMYFKDYINEAKDLKWVEDLEVEATELTNKDLAAGQIIVSGMTTPKTTIDAKEVAKVKNKETKTYINDASELVVYVADSNVNAKELLNKKVDIMFGKDNVATLVVVREDVSVDLLTKVLVKDEKVVIGSEDYKLDDDLVIYINNIKYAENADIDDVADIVDVVNGAESVDTKTITKAIKADVVVNDVNKIEKLALEVSGNLDFGDIEVTQFIVEEVEDDEIKAISAFSGNVIDIEKLEDQEEVLTVIKDGEEATLADIAAGDVITYTLNKADADYDTYEELAVIYVSSERVTGTVTRINQKSVITIDGTAYYANASVVGDLAKDIEDAKAPFDVNDVFEEEVELYLNYLGEYVAVLAETEGGDYNFGIVKKIIDDAAEVDENDAISVRILTANGENKKYSIIGDDDDNVNVANIKATNSGSVATLFAETNTTPFFVAYKVTGEDKIKEDDIIVINSAVTGEDGEGNPIRLELGNEEYEIKVGSVADPAVDTIANVTTVVDYSEDEIMGVEFDSAAVVFSLGLGTEEKDADEVEILSAGFDAIVDDNDDTVVDDESFVVINDNDEIEVVVVTGKLGYMDSEAEYAFVLDIEVAKDNAYKVTLFVEGEEKVYTTTAGNITTFGINDFIKYDITASGKLNKDAVEVLDVDGIAELDLTDSLIGLVNKDEVENGATVYNTDKKHVTVDEVTKSLKIKFAEENAVGNIKLEEDKDEFDGVIYDLTDLEAPKMVTNIKDIEGKVVFAIKSESNKDANIIVIIER